MWAQPGGDAYYAWALKASTTTTMTPDEVHQMGLEELRALQARMDPILRTLGYTKGSVGERMQALGKDSRYKFAPGDKGRAEIMAFIEERLRIIRSKLPQMFNTMVRGNLEVRRLPPEEEPGAPGAYGGAGSIDGSIPGKFWINLRTTGLHTKFDLPDLTHHEAIPGHVWQGEYANKLPLIRTLLSFNAYSEGWALYAQQLADEFGVYDDFPAGRLGHLQGIAFRAVRLVVDTGLHAKRWSREQGVRFGVRQRLQLDVGGDGSPATVEPAPLRRLSAGDDDDRALAEGREKLTAQVAANCLEPLIGVEQEQGTLLGAGTGDRILECLRNRREIAAFHDIRHPAGRPPAPRDLAQQRALADSAGTVEEHHAHGRVVHEQALH